jgi:hypothetical protein
MCARRARSHFESHQNSYFFPSFSCPNRVHWTKPPTAWFSLACGSSGVKILKAKHKVTSRKNQRSSGDVNGKIGEVDGWLADSGKKVEESERGGSDTGPKFVA